MLDVALRDAEHALVRVHPQLAETEAADDGHCHGSSRAAENLAYLILALRDTLGAYYDACCPPSDERP